MRVPYTWLKDFIDIDMPAADLARLLTHAGIEVEEVTSLQPAFDGVIVAEVVSIEKHPEADKLFVTRVNDGTEEKTVVAGINNIVPGDRVPLAVPGAVLPGGVKIKCSKLRGVESNGMLCSAEELGLPLNPGINGIFVLDQETPLGVPLQDALFLNDPVLVLGLTPNRADCLGLIGVAHEVAALTGLRVQMPNNSLPQRTPTLPVPKISIRDARLCARYAGLVIKDVRISLSPVWLQVRLLQAGIRPISNIVDVTNYCMWEWGQPLHAFDYHTLAEHSVVVRRAVPGESLVTLDNNLRQLTPDMLVIADPDRAVGLAGVMGGLDTEVTDSTTTVFLESAHFDPVNIRRTGRSLGLYSEAQQRFEKGVDINGCTQALRRAARLIELLEAGLVDGDIVDEYLTPVYPKQIRLRPERARKLLGLEISQLEMANIFLRQGFQVDAGTQLHVTVPTLRADLQEEVDLIEEIARIYGYDKIATTLPGGALTQGMRTDKQKAQKKAKAILTSCGVTEVINYSFVSPQHHDKLRLPSQSDLRKAMQLANPLSEEQSMMRTMLAGGLLDTVAYNHNRNQYDLKLFEIGAVYLPVQEPLAKLPQEKMTLCLAVTGSLYTDHWQQKPTPADFFAAKGIVESVVSQLGISHVTYSQAELPWCQPGQTAIISLHDMQIGWIGRIHPQVLDHYDIGKPVFAAEMDMDILLEHARLVTEYKPLPRYPAVLRDLAVIVPDGVAATSVMAVIRETGGALVESVALFDQYRGPQIPAGCRSLAFAITFRDPGRTLSDDVVSDIHQKIEAALAVHLGAGLRA